MPRWMPTWIIQPRRKKRRWNRSPFPPSKWGPMAVECVRDAEWFWGLMDEVYDDSDPPTASTTRGYWWCREGLLEAFSDGRLFGVCVPPTESMQLVDHLPQIGREHLWRSVSSWKRYLLPCFIVMYTDRLTVDKVWTHPRLRRHGLARMMVRALNLRRIEHVEGNDGCREFFTAMGFDTGLRRPCAARCWPHRRTNRCRGHWSCMIL